MLEVRESDRFRISVRGVQARRETGDAKRHLDGTLAVICDKLAECRARYPEDFASTGEDGPAIAVATLSRF